MNRAQQIRAVFRELRHALGEQLAAAETLACAASLVELFEEEEDVPAFSLREGGVPFEMQALDVAFADGGWKVLSREWRVLGLDVEEEYDRLSLSSELRLN